MNRKRRWKWGFALVAVVLLAGLVGCQPNVPASGEIEATETSEATEIVMPTGVFQEPAEEEVSNPGAYSLIGNIDPLCESLISELVSDNPDVPDGIILTGIQDGIQDTLDALANAGSIVVEGEALDQINLDSPVGNIDYLALYTLADGVPLADAVKMFNDQAIEDGAVAFADPNYLFGSPWDVEGSPLRKSGGASVVPYDVAEAAYWDQWAATSVAGASAFSDRGGGGSRVIVFDTSPFQDAGPYLFEMDEEDLELCVVNPFDVESPGNENATLGLNQHGLFVAGLVHAIAPESEIYLIRVLDSNARGTLFRLLDVMVQYMTQAEPVGDDVFNLSLGFRPDPDLELTPGQFEAYRDFIKNVLDLAYVPDSDQEILPVVAMRVVTELAERQGAIVVAAAGNEDDPVMDYPARYDNVVGVSAVNQSGAYSCFSNEGGVEIPGGDGVLKNGLCTPPTDMTYEPCLSDTPDLLDVLKTCEFGVLSIFVPGSLAGEKGDFQHGYWLGTSFTAPLQSGLEAW